jgi:hypothetical protein
VTLTSWHAASSVTPARRLRVSDLERWKSNMHPRYGTGSIQPAPSAGDASIAPVIPGL